MNFFIFMFHITGIAKGVFISIEHFFNFFTLLERSITFFHKAGFNEDCTAIDGQQQLRSDGLNA
jgi:hypothetical protein